MRTAKKRTRRRIRPIVDGLVEDSGYILIHTDRLRFWMPPEDLGALLDRLNAVLAGERGHVVFWPIRPSRTPADQLVRRLRRRPMRARPLLFDVDGETVQLVSAEAVVELGRRGAERLIRCLRGMLDSEFFTSFSIDVLQVRRLLAEEHKIYVEKIGDQRYGAKATGRLPDYRLRDANGW